MLVLCHERARPGLQVFEKPLELPVHLMVPGDFPVSLLDVLHHVDDLAQDIVECGDRLAGWRRVGGRTGPFHEKVRAPVELTLACVLNRYFQNPDPKVARAYRNAKTSGNTHPGRIPPRAVRRSGFGQVPAPTGFAPLWARCTGGAPCDAPLPKSKHDPRGRRRGPTSQQARVRPPVPTRRDGRQMLALQSRPTGKRNVTSTTLLPW